MSVFLLQVGPLIATHLSYSSSKMSSMLAFMFLRYL